MADAEDLKSSGDFSSCGFDSHPGHQSFLLKMNELLRRSVPCTSGVPHFAKERADLPFGPKLTHIRQIGPLQPQELYRTQQYATAVYRSELAHRLQELGYEIEHGKSGQPEIKGYSREYLDASSPRRK
jgi:TrwC relaxase